MEGSYIFFDAGVLETKGALINDAEPLKSEGIGVFGFRPDGAPIFLNHENNVAHLTWSDDQFNYSPLALWHSGQHNFYAYYPYGSSIIDITGISDSRPYITYTQPTTLDAMVDVMTDSQSAASSDGQVTFTLAHRLFAFAVKVSNLQTESDKSLVIKSATIDFQANTIPASATLYFDDQNKDDVPDMTAGSSIASLLQHRYTVSQETIANGSSRDINDDNFFLFAPCPSLSIKMSLTIVGAWGDEVEITIPTQDSATDGDEYYTLTPDGNGFLPGHKYFFNIKKADKSIEFTLEDAGLAWEENEDIDIGFN